MYIICTVTNDLTYDQRMQRICTTLAQAGYSVTLTGRMLPHSLPLEENLPYRQKRLPCFFRKGFLFYAEYNLRLFFWLLGRPFDAVCSIDLDTLPAGCLASLLRRKRRVFDAHEYFTEVPEVVGRPLVRAFWGMVARVCLPYYRHAYTVGPSLAALFSEKYGIDFQVVRNTPQRSRAGGKISPEDQPKVGLYQGALNEGRGIEVLLLATARIENFLLLLAGEGDRSEALRKEAARLGLGEKVRFLGRVKPADLPALTARAWVGLNLLENRGLSYYHSLANKFFDYVQAGKPVITMNFPEYRALNAEFEVAILLDELSPEAVSAALLRLQNEPRLYERLQANCEQACQKWIWEKDAEVLLSVWTAVFSTGP